MSSQEVFSATSVYIATHTRDLDYVGGHGRKYGIYDRPVFGDYGLIQPKMNDIDVLLAANVLAQFCMDKRQIAQVHESLGIDGQSRLLLSTAGGAEQRGNRFANDAKFWTKILNEGSAHALILGVHTDGCGGAKAMEGERIVNKWIKDGVEKTRMIDRANSMRDTIWKNLKRRNVQIDLSCANIKDNNFVGISKHG